jgi:hypothetical protein
VNLKAEQNPEHLQSVFGAGSRPQRTSSMFVIDRPRIQATVQLEELLNSRTVCQAAGSDSSAGVYDTISQRAQAITAVQIDSVSEAPPPRPSLSPCDGLEHAACRRGGGSSTGSKSDSSTGSHTQEIPALVATWH